VAPFDDAAEGEEDVARIVVPWIARCGARRGAGRTAARAGDMMTLPLLVNIDVDDVEKGIAFYRAALGVEVGRRLGDDYVELVGASSPIYLLKKPAGSQVAEEIAATRQYARHWTPVHLDLVVVDVTAAVARARAAGALLEGEIRDRDWGRLAVMADPFGHGFCFVQFSDRGYDVLATKPSPETGGEPG
jgi:catechol 2,3-dioxygenase-like lactoylglutathione lyase family enzyme